ncbi:MAG: cytidylate kinase-like family protein [Lentisphaerae bacterium]|nr:cytidylate kinase-like family protein [Lentisphaerota bacterium]
MTPHESLNMLKGYLGAQHYGTPGGGAPVIQPFITLSREAGAGGISIGTLLRDRLQAEDKHAFSPWLWFDRDLLAKVVEQHNLPKEVAHTMDQPNYHRVLKWIDEMMGQYPSWSLLARKTNETIMFLARIGNVILVGRGANILTRDMPGGLHVRLIGSMPKRIGHVVEYYKLTRLEAEKFIAREDSSRAMYVKDNFGADIQNAHGYDLTINTDHVRYEDAVTLIMEQVARMRMRLGPASTGVR